MIYRIGFVLCFIFISTSAHHFGTGTQWWIVNPKLQSLETVILSQKMWKFATQKQRKLLCQLQWTLTEDTFSVSDIWKKDLQFTWLVQQKCSCKHQCHKRRNKFSLTVHDWQCEEQTWFIWNAWEPNKTQRCHILGWACDTEEMTNNKRKKCLLIKSHCWDQWRMKQVSQSCVTCLCLLCESQFDPTQLCLCHVTVSWQSHSSLTIENLLWKALGDTRIVSIACQQKS